MKNTDRHRQTLAQSEKETATLSVALYSHIKLAFTLECASTEHAFVYIIQNYYYYLCAAKVNLSQYLFDSTLYAILCTACANTPETRAAMVTTRFCTVIANCAHTVA